MCPTRESVELLPAQYATVDCETSLCFLSISINTVRGIKAEIVQDVNIVHSTEAEIVPDMNIIYISEAENVPGVNIVHGTKAENVPGVNIEHGTEAEIVPNVNTVHGTEAEIVPDVNIIHGTKAEIVPDVNPVHGTKAEKVPGVNIVHSTKAKKVPGVNIVHGTETEIVPDENTIHGTKAENAPGMNIVHGTMAERIPGVNIVHGTKAKIMPDVKTLHGTEAENVPDDDDFVFLDASKWRNKEADDDVHFLLHFATVQQGNAIIVSVTVNLNRLRYVLSRSRYEELMRLYQVYGSSYSDLHWTCGCTASGVRYGHVTFKVGGTAEEESQTYCRNPQYSFLDEEDVWDVTDDIELQEEIMNGPMSDEDYIGDLLEENWEEYFEENSSFQSPCRCDEEDYERDFTYLEDLINDPDDLQM